MESVLLVVADWRFASAAVLLGALLGHFVYKKIPAPGSSAIHFQKMVRAGVAGAAARQAGAKPFEFMADVVGAHAAGALNAGLRRQRRWCLVGGLVATAIALVPVFLLSPLTTVVPSWAFAACGALGVYRTWKLW
jgi:hypothetical protein